MTATGYVQSLVQYGIRKELIEPCDRSYTINRLQHVLQLDHIDEAESRCIPLEEILRGLLDDAVRRGICLADMASRDLLHTELMGILTPPPREVRQKFTSLYKSNPKQATDWFYKFSQNTGYVRPRENSHWRTFSEYGLMDIAYESQKQELDWNNADCPLCGMTQGNSLFIEQQNHRIIPINLEDSHWFMCYHPSAQFNEHCLLFSEDHAPVTCASDAFSKQIDFIRKFPHYTIAYDSSTANVGHAHFEGGHALFPLESAVTEKRLSFKGFSTVQACLVKWPFTVIRLTAMKPEKMIRLAAKIHSCWLSSADSDRRFVCIARRRGKAFELDLVLLGKNDSPATQSFPIAHRNLVLSEIMGMLTIPAKLQQAMPLLETTLATGTALPNEYSQYAAWMDEITQKYTITPQNALTILRNEIANALVQAMESNSMFPDAVTFQEFIQFINSVK